MQAITWEFEWLENLVSEFYEGRLLEHPDDESDYNVCKTLDNIYWALPTPVIYTIKINKQVYVIKNYQLIKQLSETLIDNHLGINFDTTDGRFKFNKGIPVDVIYNNVKLFLLFKNNQFTNLEIDQLKNCHNDLHKCKIPAYRIHDVKRIDLYKEFNYDN